MRTMSDTGRERNYSSDDWNRRLLNPESGMRSINHGYHTALNEIAVLEAVSADLCDECGWAMKFPDGCVNCKCALLQALANET